MSYQQLWVDGTPAPKGSMVSVGSGHMRHQNPAAVASWADEVGWAWRQRFRANEIERYRAVRVELTFFVARPDSVTIENRRYPTARGAGSGGDIDKLTRATLDALEGLAYEDDSQVIHVDALKLYENDQPQGATGARISIARYHFGPAPWPTRWAQLR